MLLFGKKEKTPVEDIGPSDPVEYKIWAANIARYLGHDKLADVLLEDAQEILDKEKKIAETKDGKK